MEELVHAADAAILKSSEDGLNNFAWVLKRLNENPTVNSSKFHSSFENPQKPVIVFTPEESLATIIHIKLTQRQYKKMRQMQKKHNTKLYLSWEKVMEAKKKCQPNNIDFTSKIGEVSVPMQDVITHQLSKIMEFSEFRQKYENILES